MQQPQSQRPSGASQAAVARSNPPENRRKVLVIGGGAAGLSAAWHLSCDPRHDWQITVLQRGWRLGGKGRSGRNLQPGMHLRNEEHGIHVLFGFYHCAFATLREVFASLNRPAGHPLRTVFDGVIPVRTLRFIDDGVACSVAVPDTPGLPGDPNAGLLPPIAELPARIVSLLVSATQDLLRDASQPGALRWRRQALSLGLAIARGMLIDGLVQRDFSAFQRATDRIEALDFRAWLARHGASDEAIDGPLVRTVYQLGFADDARAGAGTTLLGLLRIFGGYRGALMYRLAAGMGDVLFAPWHEALLRRGVHVRFFHRLDRLELSADGHRVEALHVGVQARSVQPYQPLIRAGGIDAWPAEPLWGQLADGERLQQTGVDFESDGAKSQVEEAETAIFRADRDFDVVVLALPPAVLKTMAQPLVAHPDPTVSSRWRTMLGTVDTTATAMLQLWSHRSLAELGVPTDSMVGNCAKPFDCWTDMSSALKWEPRPAPHRSLVYACAALSAAEDADETPSSQQRWRAAVQAAANHWQDTNGREQLGDPHDWHSWANANLQRSDRYTRSAPGTRHLRLASHQSGVENLFLAGDWTRTGLDAGCVEAAIMSGMQASRAICGYPQRVLGEHPDLVPHSAWVDRL